MKKEVVIQQARPQRARGTRSNSGSAVHSVAAYASQAPGPLNLLDYEIKGSPVFSEVIVKLRAGESIVADAGALQYMRGGVEHSGLKMGGLLKAVGRWLSDEGVFLNKYSGTDQARPGTVCFASCFPGDAFALRLSPGEQWKLSRGAYVASTENVKVSGKLNWRGLVSFGQEEGLVLPKITCDDGPADGVVFVSAYGGYHRHDLEPGEKLLVNNGLFLACKADVSYTIEKLGRSYLSSLIGGEGLGMSFVGPCTVYTQSRNFNDLVAEICSRLPDSGASFDMDGGGVNKGKEGKEGKQGKKGKKGSRAQLPRKPRGPAGGGQQKDTL